MPGKRGARAGHRDATIYIVWVLWLIGFSENSIAKVLTLRKKQVAGLVGRSPYTNRSEMGDPEREAALKALLSARIDEDGRPLDGGILDRIPMKIIPLRRTQRRG